MEEDIGKLTTKELGILFPIIIMDYNPEWINFYTLERQKITRILGNTIINRIEHIGSTAIPGMCAKPTIDILLEINESSDLDLLRDRLRNIDYQCIPKPENPPPHLMFAKGYTLKGTSGQTFHIHARYPGDWDEISFRDYLAGNPVTALEYADLKRKLSYEFRNDREKYTEGKTDFIKKIIQIARMKKDLSAM